MDESRSNKLLLWIGAGVFAAGIAVLAGFWVYGVASAEDLPVLLVVALIAIPTGLAVLLLSAIRDRLAQKKQENFLEVDN